MFTFNPYSDLLNFARQINEEEQQRASILAGKKRQDPGEWGPHFQRREAELQALIDAALQVAERTGFPVADVERRVISLAAPLRAILLWQRDAPCLSREEQVR